MENCPVTTNYPAGMPHQIAASSRRIGYQASKTHHPTDNRQPNMINAAGHRSTSFEGLKLIVIERTASIAGCLAL